MQYIEFTRWASHSLVIERFYWKFNSFGLSVFTNISVRDFLSCPLFICIWNQTTKLINTFPFQSRPHVQRNLLRTRTGCSWTTHSRGSRGWHRGGRYRPNRLWSRQWSDKNYLSLVRRNILWHYIVLMDNLGIHKTSLFYECD